MHVCIKCGRNISNTQKKQLWLPAIPDRVPRVGWRQVAILIAAAALLWSTPKCSSALSLIRSRNDKLRKKGTNLPKILLIANAVGGNCPKHFIAKNCNQ